MHVLGIPTFVFSNVCMQVKLVNIISYVQILSYHHHTIKYYYHTTNLLTDTTVHVCERSVSKLELIENSKKLMSDLAMLSTENERAKKA